MIGEEWKNLGRPDLCQCVLQMVATQGPDGRRIELLRSTSHPSLEPGGDAHQRLFGLAEMGVQAGERDGRLAGMFGLAPDGGHQPRPAGDRFTPTRAPIYRRTKRLKRKPIGLPLTSFFLDFYLSQGLLTWANPIFSNYPSLPKSSRQALWQLP